MRCGARIERASRLSLGAFSPLAAPALSAATPGGALARAAVLARVPRGRIELNDLRSRVDALGPRFDGRLRLVAVDRGSGRRVVFGDDGAPEASVADAVAASCAVPGLFAPVAIGDREYVDGGVWSPTNLDLARAGKRRPRALPRARRRRWAPRPALALRGLAAGWRLATSVEAAAAGRRGAKVEIVAPGRRRGRRDGQRPDESRAARARARRGLPAGRWPTGVDCHPCPAWSLCSP